jgi:hypothetical protein
MTDPRRWLLWSSVSGGTYHLELDGDRVRHVYAGEAIGLPSSGLEDEWLSAFLARGRDPRGLADERLGAVMAGIRASLDGVYTLVRGYLRVDHGRPVEIFGEIYCSDPGVGGHVCSFNCSGRVTYENEIPRAEVLVGEPLLVGEWTCQGPGAYGGKVGAPVRRAREPAA